MNSTKFATFAKIKVHKKLAEVEVVDGAHTGKNYTL